MTAEKSKNNDKPSSPAEKFKPGDEMSGDEMYAVARTLPNDDPRKADLENEMRKLYGSVLDRLTPEWKAVIPNVLLPAGTQENPSFGVWEGDPTRWAPGEAWAFMKGAWTRVDSTEVGMNSPVLSKAEFTSRFGALPPLPATAFQAPSNPSKKGM
jgi:hypothetical protein